MALGVTPEFTGLRIALIRPKPGMDMKFSEPIAASESTSAAERVSNNRSLSLDGISKG